MIENQSDNIDIKNFIFNLFFIFNIKDLRKKLLFRMRRNSKKKLNYVS